MNRWKLPSINVWLTTLLLLNALDMLMTVPLYEANPVTLIFWERFGIGFAAGIKIFLVLFLGILWAVAKKVSTPHEMKLANQFFRFIFVFLIAYYVFIIAANLTVIVPVLLGF